MRGLVVGMLITAAVLLGVLAGVCCSRGEVVPAILLAVGAGVAAGLVCRIVWEGDRRGSA